MADLWQEDRELGWYWRRWRNSRSRGWSSHARLLLTGDREALSQMGRPDELRPVELLLDALECGAPIVPSSRSATRRRRWASVAARTTASTTFLMSFQPGVIRPCGGGCCEVDFA